MIMICGVCGLPIEDGDGVYGLAASWLVHKACAPPAAPFIVLWRGDQAEPWRVHPVLVDAYQASEMSRAWLQDFGGETICCSIAVPAPGQPLRLTGAPGAASEG